MAEVFARRKAQNLAESEALAVWLATPEGQEHTARQRRLAEADARYAEENPPEDEAEDEEDAP